MSVLSSCGGVGCFGFEETPAQAAPVLIDSQRSEATIASVKVGLQILFDTIRYRLKTPLWNQVIGRIQAALQLTGLERSLCSCQAQPLGTLRSFHNRRLAW